MGHGTEYLSNSGRHYRDNAQTWTPHVPPQVRSDKGGAHESRPGMSPAAGNTRGRLAGELPAIPAPRQRRGDRRTQAAGYPASRGELPLATPSASESEQAPRRTRVSFSELEPASGAEQQAEPADGADGAQTPDDPSADAEDVQNGLGMFDLGSVPASVTPPSTWRRAAWFAAASSGGVMGLLFAGTFLLGQQPDQPQAIEHWSYLNRRGGAPLFDRDELLNQTNRVPPPGQSTVTGTSARQARQAQPPAPSTSGPSGSASSTTSRDGAGARPGPSSRTGEQPASSADEPSTQHTTSRPATPTTTPIPEKPPPSPPESEVVNPMRGLMPPQYNWHEMAKVSNNYLNTVTENPSKARQYTTGELHAKGADGLRRKYSRIAYFEVRKITVDESRGTAVNTVQVVYKDGHTEIQKRTLTFSADGKISHAGR